MRKDISSWKIAHSEDRGVNKKVWVTDPEKGKEALYKETQIKDNSESTYADFAESIVSDLCKLLGVSCAEVDLVQRDGQKGCISYNFCSSDIYEELIEMGSVIQNTRLRFQSKSMYDPESKESYGVEMILEGLESIAVNKSNFSDLRKSFFKDLLTDSLIDHYDRNPANLAVIRNLNTVKLSPKYDNGTSLSIAVPEYALTDLINSGSNERTIHESLRERVLSKIGYLGRKFVKYPDLETFVFNYYYDDVKDFVATIQERLTDENIDKILSSEKYDELGEVHKQIIRGKLRTNRDTMLERFRIISKKNTIDKIVYNKAASNNFISHVEKGTIPEIIPEYNFCVGVEDEDTDYDMSLDYQIPEKIQTIVDITQLARYFDMPIGSLTKREKSLLKWTTIMENIQKASKDPNTFTTITNRLGFLEEDKKLLNAIIKDKFKDENDILEAREIIYGEDGIGEENINLYLSKKFVDAATMRKDIRDKRMEELRTFARTMKEAVELENIVEKLPIRVRTLQRFGITDKEQIVAIQYEVAKKYRKNPRMTHGDIVQFANDLASVQLKDFKEEILPGIFVDKKAAEEVRQHTIDLNSGKKLVLFDKTTKFSDIAFKMGADYFGQVATHHSGSGVTISLLTKKGLDFPKSVLEYAESVIEKYSKPDFPKGSFVLKQPQGKKPTSCFVVTSVNGSDAKIPNITTDQMCKKLVKLFNERQKDKTLDE